MNVVYKRHKVDEVFIIEPNFELIEFHLIRAEDVVWKDAVIKDESGSQEGLS